MTEHITWAEEKYFQSGWGTDVRVSCEYVLNYVQYSYRDPMLMSPL
jgi:hypothetical protein